MNNLLAEYGLAGAQTRVLKRSENLTLLVYTPSGRFVLRVSPAGTPLARIEAELSWQDALRRDTELLTARPVANLRDALVTEWRPSPALPARQCVLFEWVAGAPIGAHVSPSLTTRLGTVMATLHRHARAYTPARAGTFVGPRYDAAWLTGAGSWWSERAVEDLGEQRCAGLTGPIEAVARLLKARGEAHDAFGIIHGDLHPANVLAGDDGTTVIDFECLALGDYLFDMAVTELELLDEADSDELIRQFRSGYAAATGVPLTTLEPAGLMRVAAGVALIEWLYGRAPPAERTARMRGVPALLTNMQRAAA